MSAPLRAAFVGYGRIARDYRTVVAELDEFELAAVVDTDPAARAAANDEANVPAHESIRELLVEHDLDAAFVLTPPSSHDELVFELIDSGMHVLCEKPIAMAVGTAGRMFQVAARAGRVLTMASKFRYLSDVVRAHELIGDGCIGEVVGFENAFCARTDMTERWNADPLISGGGVMIDNGSHSVDLARGFLGPIVKVLAHFGRRMQPVHVEDSVRLMFETVRGGTGVIELSWSFELGLDHYASVIGTDGTLQLGWEQSRYRRAGDKSWTSFGDGYDKRRAMAAQLRDFARAVRDGSTPLVTPGDAVESVRAIDAAYRSARVARWVPLQMSHVPV